MSIPFTYVYLIHDPFTNLYKIGKADNPEARLKTLCSPSSYGTIPAAPTDYVLIDAWLCPESTERRLHELFSEMRVRGEWFQLSPEFMACFRAEMYSYPRLNDRWSEEVSDLHMQCSDLWYAYKYMSAGLGFYKRMFFLLTYGLSRSMRPKQLTDGDWGVNGKS